MTEEEKKAIELLRKLKKKTPYIIWDDRTPYNKSNQIQTVLNLIEKQQKEIENLLQDYKQDEKIIQEMAEYIRNIKTDYEQDYCNIENCNYHKTNCSNKCIIDYFRKRCKQ